MKETPRFEGAGQGKERSKTNSSPPDTALDCEHQVYVDPRLALMLRASAKLHLVESGHQTLDLAFAELVPAFREIAAQPCECEREIINNFKRHERTMREKWLHDWRWRCRS